MASRLYSREPELWLRQKPAAPLLCHSERSRPTFSSAFAPARCLRPESFSGTSALACGCEESLFSYDRLPQQESSSCWALATSSFPVVHSTYPCPPRLRTSPPPLIPLLQPAPDAPRGATKSSPGTCPASGERQWPTETVSMPPKKSRYLLPSRSQRYCISTFS